MLLAICDLSAVVKTDCLKFRGDFALALHTLKDQTQDEETACFCDFISSLIFFKYSFFHKVFFNIGFVTI